MLRHFFGEKTMAFWTAVGAMAAVAGVIWAVVSFGASSTTGGNDRPTVSPEDFVVGGSGSSITAGPATRPARVTHNPQDAFRGTWEGSVFQYNPGQRYPVEIVISPTDAGRIVGKSIYQSLKCSGELEFVSVSGNTMRVIEHITQGAAGFFGGCVQTGYITLELRGDDSLYFQWYESEGDFAEVVVDGLLARR